MAIAVPVSQLAAKSQRRREQAPRRLPEQVDVDGRPLLPRTRTSSAPATPADHVDRLIAGDAAAYARLLREHGPRMLTVAKRYLRRTHDAEDAVQDAFVNVVRSISSFKRESRIETWLHRIVVNCALMRLRSQRRKPHITLPESAARGEAPAHWIRPAPPSAHDALALSETRRSVLAVISELPARQRQLLVLRQLDTLKMKQLAEVLDIPVSTAKVGLHRARRRLKCALASDPRHTDAVGA